MSAALALTLALALSACGGDDTTDSNGVNAQETTSQAPASGTASSTDDDDDTSDDADDTSNDADGTSDDAQGSAAGTGADAAGLTAAGLVAITAAEEETGGTAYEIDDQDDDGSWEVQVRIGDAAQEVQVGADGEFLGTEDDDLDADDRDALDAATLTLAEAIETAVAEVGGQLDDAELEEEDGTYVWKVSLDGTDDGEDDVDVHVDTVSGEVVKVD